MNTIISINTKIYTVFTILMLLSNKEMGSDYTHGEGILPKS